MSAEPSREEIEATPGAMVLEFGATWCGYCRAARPLIDSALSIHSGLRYLRIEDGKGKRLGRSFGVKLWPTLVFLRDGEEIARLVRPSSVDHVSEALERLG